MDASARKWIVAAVLLAAAIVLAGTYLVRLPPAMHVAYALEGSPLQGRLSAWYLGYCPTMDAKEFQPNSIIGAVLAGTTDTNRPRAEHLIESLVACGVSLERADDLGLRPLHTAILYGDLESVRFLIRLGADESAPIGRCGGSVAGLAPLAFAERVAAKGGTGHKAVLRFLQARNTTGNP